MPQEKHLYSRNELIDQIKHCGQSIIDNAEGILGNERYFESITVIFNINRSRNWMPDIQIQRRFIPELEIEDLKTYNELKKEK
jgi:hypothetical protein